MSAPAAARISADGQYGPPIPAIIKKMGYTPIPNVLIESLMRLLPPKAYQLLCNLIRQTAGVSSRRQTERPTICMSTYKQLGEAMGCHANSVGNNMALLKELDLVEDVLTLRGTKMRNSAVSVAYGNFESISAAMVKAARKKVGYKSAPGDDGENADAEDGSQTGNEDDDTGDEEYHDDDQKRAASASQGTDRPRSALRIVPTEALVMTPTHPAPRPLSEACPRAQNCELLDEANKGRNIFPDGLKTSADSTGTCMADEHNLCHSHSPLVPLPNSAVLTTPATDSGEWVGVKERLRRNLTPEAWENWVAQSRQTGLRDGQTLLVTVPNEFAKEWLELECPDKVKAALPAGITTVVYEVRASAPAQGSPASAQQPHPPEKSKAVVSAEAVYAQALKFGIRGPGSDARSFVRDVAVLFESHANGALKRLTSGEKQSYLSKRGPHMPAIFFDIAEQARDEALIAAGLGSVIDRRTKRNRDERA